MIPNSNVPHFRIVSMCEKVRHQSFVLKSILDLVRDDRLEPDPADIQTLVVVLDNWLSQLDGIIERDLKPLTERNFSMTEREIIAAEEQAASGKDGG